MLAIPLLSPLRLVNNVEEVWRDWRFRIANGPEIFDWERLMRWLPEKQITNWRMRCVGQHFSFGQRDLARPFPPRNGARLNAHSCGEKLLVKACPMACPTQYWSLKGDVFHAAPLSHPSI